MQNRESTHLVTSAFGISGDDLNPEECTARFGIQPTRAARKGTKLRPDSIGTLIHSVWNIRFDKVAGETIDGGLRKVLDRIWPAREAIVDFLRGTEFSGKFATNVTFFDIPPSMRIQPETLRRISFFEVEHLYDIFDYS